MSDLITCQKCGKSTNKYAPACLHCGALLEKNIPSPQTASSEEKSDVMERIVLPRLKKCPLCAEEIQYDAVKCKFCGSILKSAKKNKNFNIPIIAVLFLILLAGIGVFVITNVRYDKALGTYAVKVAVTGKDDYIKNFITLSGIGTLDETTPRSLAPMKYAYGTVKNLGQKTINKIKVRVYYFNKANKRIGRDSAWSFFGSTAKPVQLKPGESKEFKFLIGDINPEWSGKIEAKVADVEFAD